MEHDVERAYDDLDGIKAALFPYRDHGRIERAMALIRDAMDELEYVMDDPANETESV